VLSCMNGAFADKWNDVALRNGKQASALKFEWGQPVDPDAVRKELSTGAYDAITIIHNETSCGCMSDLAAVMKVVREFPEVISIVDTVSSFSAMPIKKDELGIDVFITGSQKALALPPGLSLISASKRALERAATLPDRGYYFDFLEFQKNAEQNMTPSTPSVSHTYALSSKLDEFFAEGLEARYARHRKTNQMIRDWANANGFTLFPESGFESLTLTCINNGAKSGGRVVDVPKLQKLVKDQGFLIDGGYGKIKGTTFRISNMGDETEASMNQLIAALDKAMKQL